MKTCFIIKLIRLYPSSTVSRCARLLIIVLHLQLLSDQDSRRGSQPLKIFIFNIKMQAMLDLSKEPIWSLERRPSSGYLVWRRDKSKVRFRFEVEVLEFEKNPDEHRVCDDYTGPSIISSTIVVFVTCVTAVALTLYLPWYLVGHN